MSNFPPHVLREYTFVADGERGAVIGPRGDVAWLCMPRWDSEPVFSSLIGGGGMYAVTPTDTAFVWGGHYEPNSLIWTTLWTTVSGQVECRTALAYPGDRDRAVLLRRVRAVHSDTRISVLLDPRPSFGRGKMTHLHQDDAGNWTARVGSAHLRWSGAVSHAHCDDDLALETSINLREGETVDFVLELSTHEPRGAAPDPDSCWKATEKAWEKAVPTIRGSLADGDAAHAYAVLRGLTTSGGGMVAAATMCLPERAEAGRNYDYRYAWIRDQAYAGTAVARLGPVPLLTDAMSFITDRLLADGSQLRPAYTVAGGSVPNERDLDLPGYPGGSDKVGNWVNKQFQLDSLGESLQLFAAAGRHDLLESRNWKAVTAAVAAIEQRWTEPDAGIWELEPQRWAHSRLACVGGLNAIAPFAPAASRERWQDLARTLMSSVLDDCVHPSGRWQRSPGDSRLDSALIIPTVRGAVSPDDPHAVATLRAALRELSEDHFMYRFRQGSGPPGQAEGAFLLCGFATAMALHQRGDRVEAARWFECNRAACGPPGLLAEEYDVQQRQIRGNLPQAFVHAMLLEAALRLAD